MENHDGQTAQSKYQKLAAEYSKVRAQNVVLKKAILEEQQKSSKHNELLQSVRKAEQENDSLTFRNQQLSKRVAILQEDLEKHENKSARKSSVTSNKKDAKKSSSGEDINVDVLVQDLQCKINENAELHSRVSEMEQAASLERNSLQHSMEEQLHLSKERLSILTQQNKELTMELKSAMDSMEMHHRTTKCKIEQLESDQLASQVTLEQQNKYIMKLKQQLVDAKITPPTLTPVHSAAESYCGEGTKGLFSPQSISSSSSYASLLPHEDQPTKPTHLNLLNPMNLSATLPSIPILSRDFCLKFASFIRVYCELKQSKAQLSEDKDLANIGAVTHGVTHWEKLAPLLENVLENTLSTGEKVLPPPSSKGPPGTIGTVTASTLTHLRLLCSIPSAAPFQSSLRSIQSCWSAVLPYLSALSANSNRTHSHTTLVRLLGLLADRYSSLKNAVDEAVKKWTEEDERDAVVSTELQELSLVCGQLTYALKMYLDSDDNQQQSSSINTELKNTHSTETLSPMKKEVTASSLSSPDESQISNFSAISINLSTQNSNPSDALSKASVEKVSQLHRQREHWRLEYHLLSHKFTKLLKSVKEKKQEAEERSSPIKIAPSSMVGEAKLDVAENAPPSPSTTKKSSESDIDVDSSETWRESMVRNHLSSRCNKLYLELNELSTRASVYQDDCEAAMKRLAGSEEQKITYELEIETVRKEKSSLSDELRTTCNNYEEQISAMSEHLADMNEKLAAYEEQICQLKQQSSKKGKK